VAASVIAGAPGAKQKWLIMQTDPDQLLNRLVVVALTVFVTVSLLLAAVLFRELWLQQRIANLSTTLQDNLENLEETTEEIQSELSALQTVTDSVQQSENLETVTDLLGDANEQMSTLGEEIGEVAAILEPAAETVPVETAVADPAPPPQDRADQVFTIFALLVSITGVVIAILLGLAVRIQQRVPARRTPRR
jgi:heme/copper-type cytochrome/quinol oxidase subunit 2